jgi:hypothetical protein
LIGAQFQRDHDVLRFQRFHDRILAYIRDSRFAIHDSRIQNDHNNQPGFGAHEWVSRRPSVSTTLGTGFSDSKTAFA